MTTPPMSDVEAARLLIRLIEARRGVVPSWARELANSADKDWKR